MGGGGKVGAGVNLDGYDSQDMGNCGVGLCVCVCVCV